MRGLAIIELLGVTYMPSLIDFILFFILFTISMGLAYIFTYLAKKRVYPEMPAPLREEVPCQQGQFRLSLHDLQKRKSRVARRRPIQRKLGRI